MPTLYPHPQAAELPLPHRHRLLALAAASPDLHPLFSSMATSASSEGPCAAPLRPRPVIFMQPVPDMEAKIQGLLRKARDQVEGPTAEEGATSPTEAARHGEGALAEQVQVPVQQLPKEALALRVVSEYDVYGTCKDENVRAVVSLKVRYGWHGQGSSVWVVLRYGTLHPYLPVSTSHTPGYSLLARKL